MCCCMMRLNSFLILVMLFVTSIEVSAGQKWKNEKSVVIFEDGWQKQKPSMGVAGTGNFKVVNLKGEASQARNKKWKGQWGSWFVKAIDGIVKPGVVMIPTKHEGDAWLVSTNIALKNTNKPFIKIEGYSKYGTDKCNEFQVLVSTNYQGDVETATWKELSMDSFHKQIQSAERYLSLKKFQDKDIVIAIRSIQKGKTLKNMTRTTFISTVKVMSVIK